MSFPAFTRADVLAHLTNEVGEPLTILPWWNEAFAAIDDPAKLEILLKLVRQVGKTQWLSATNIAHCLCVPGAYAVLVAASQQQQQAIYHRKVRRPLEKFVRDLGLDSFIRFTALGFEIPDLGSALEVVVSSDNTTPGRTISLLAIDEARYVKDSVFTALLPSLIGAGGKVIVASSAGPPSGFFYQLCTNPTPASWIYESATNDNPRADQKTLSHAHSRLALVDPAAAARELNNEFAEGGESLIPWALIEAAIDDSLTGSDNSNAGAVFAGGDLSFKHDLTSLTAVVRHPARRHGAKDHVVCEWLYTQDPKKNLTKEIDFDEVRAILEDVPEVFKRLQVIWIDAGAEASSILPWAKGHKKLVRFVKPFTATSNTNMDIWGALVARFNSRTISIPRNERLLNELRGLKQESFAFGSKFRVTDGNKKYHRDISFSLALAVWAADQVQKARAGVF